MPTAQLTSAYKVNEGSLKYLHRKTTTFPSLRIPKSPSRRFALSLSRKDIWDTFITTLTKP